MLKKGKFIKEPHPEIGRHWSYSMLLRRKTEEERLTEAILRGDEVRTVTKVERFVAMLLKI